MSSLRTVTLLLLIIAFSSAAFAQEKNKGDDARPPALDTSRGDAMIAEYFRHETALLRDRTFAGVETLEDWEAIRPELRRQLFEMLGMDPLPPKTDLKPVITGTVDHEQFIVQNLHFQSRPGLYVTGNLYIPKGLTQPAPAILYVCGHARAKDAKSGVSYGNKTAYHHHGAWFARHGYICLTIDTLQLGEIEGIHHGTYREGMWWWNSRGYTPAGVEAWNCIRSLDYLQSRPEVDGERIGVTGRSGGGAYSWWIAALDDRIKAAVPVAGITDLENHIVDGTVEGHCDCMFIVNTYRWDYPLVAALVAPRPLLISNSDKDRIFPLDGVYRTHQAVKKIYDLYKAPDKLGLHITEGPHKDTQELRVHAFVWFNRFLKKDDSQIADPADKLFERQQLRVFAELPADRINSEIHETFVPKAQPPPVPTSPQQFDDLRDQWITALREKSFRGWPDHDPPLDIEQAFSVEQRGIRFSAYDFDSQHDIRLRLFLAHRADVEKFDLVTLTVLDEQTWPQFVARMAIDFADQLSDQTPELTSDEKAYESESRMLLGTKWAMAYIAPRGIGPTAWDQSEKKQIQHRRRFMLLGQTLDGMRVWDVRRAIQATRAIDAFKDTPLWLQSERQMAGVALYASLFEPPVYRLELWRLPADHRDGPTFLNVMRFLDMEQAVAMAAARSCVRIYQDQVSGWDFPRAAAANLGWDDKQLQIMAAPAGGESGH